MAFPQTAAPTVTQVSVESQTHNVNMPATVNAGDLLFVNLIVNSSADAPTVTTPSGWTQRWHSQVATGTYTSAGYVKVAAGTEGGGTVNFSTDNSATAAAQCHRVTAWFGTLSGVENGTLVEAATTNPNPPSVTASWGVEDNLFIACGGAGDDDVAWIDAPTNYTNLASTISGAGANDGCSVGSAWRELAAATDDPAMFDLASAENAAAMTLVIRPAAAGRIMSSLAGAGGLAGPGGLAGAGGGLAG